jgi:hypothetical protein
MYSMDVWFPTAMNSYLAKTVAKTNEKQPEKTMRTAELPALAKSIRPTQDALIVELDGQTVVIAWERCSPLLAAAGYAERSRAVLSPSGYGSHWPLLDEDLAVGPLIAGSELPPVANA